MPPEITPTEPREVSKADTSLFEIPPLRAASGGQPISEQIRRPVRLRDRDAKMQDLGYLAESALAGFGHKPAEKDPLRRTLVRVLAEGQGDADIHTILNGTLTQGALAAPAALITPFGELDTSRLLQLVLRASQG